MILIITSFIALTLLVWFRTDAWLEYTKLLHLNKISFYKDYEDKKSTDDTLNYHLYLRRYHDCFFTRLITCPICTAVWISVVLAIFTHIILIPIYTIGGLIIYLLIDKLLG